MGCRSPAEPRVLRPHTRRPTHRRGSGCRAPDGWAARDATVPLRRIVRAGARGRCASGRRVPDVARHDAGDRRDHRRHAGACRATWSHPAVRVPHPHRGARDRGRGESRSHPPAVAARRGRGRDDPEPVARHGFGWRVTPGRVARQLRRRRVHRVSPVDRDRPRPIRMRSGDRRRPDQVVAKLRAHTALGIDAFILSGYPHLAECDLVSRQVLPAL